MAQPNKRRLIPIVDSGFQFKYTGIILAVAVVTSTVLGLFLWKSYQEMNEIIAVAGLSPEIASALNGRDSQTVFTVTIASLFAEVVVLGVLGLLITHRVVGPVFVLQRHFQTMVDGKLPKLRPLRAGDEFASAFDMFKKAIDRQQHTDEQEAERLSTIVAAAQKNALSDDDVAYLQRLVAERKARLA